MDGGRHAALFLQPNGPTLSPYDDDIEDVVAAAATALAGCTSAVKSAIRLGAYVKVEMFAPRSPTSRRLGDIELAPPVRTDWALHSLAPRRWLELNASRTLLPILGLVLIFGSLMREFRLSE